MWCHSKLFVLVKKNPPTRSKNRLPIHLSQINSVHNSKKIPPSIVTTKGSMIQTRNNLHSVNKRYNTKNPEKTPIDHLEHITDMVFTKFIDPKQHITTDIMLRPLVIYNRGNK